ncbi:ring-cleaving dioxygenase [Phycisphaerales bacterium AB-hyl4]|uniref:Ring-cleaving dioxygenase n=1 Tax=Natronomicrosphaera hydrolytica TaxID=3242702 RepID=A0ABV4U2G2_9BACT
MQLAGIHHLTAITADAPGNLAFYTQTLGMRLVKKTVNQDDVSAYHLFYADGKGSPGTDLTFFDWPAAPERRGTRSIVRTGLRVADEASLTWWAKRLTDHGIAVSDIVKRDNRSTLDFEDPEGQRISLVVDDGVGEAHPWQDSPVAVEHQVRGLGPIVISVPDLEPTSRVLTGLMEMRQARQYTHAEATGPTTYVYEMGDAGPAAELHVRVEPDLPRARYGAGGVHHVAFRTPTFDDYEKWAERLASSGINASGPVDRFYFRSLYFREPGGILFEIATDGPGFAVDESADTLGQSLALPPFLEPQRQQIEANLKPL